MSVLHTRTRAVHRYQDIEADEELRAIADPTQFRNNDRFGWSYNMVMAATARRTELEIVRKLIDDIAEAIVSALRGGQQFLLPVCSPLTCWFVCGERVVTYGQDSLDVTYDLEEELRAQNSGEEAPSHDEF